MKVEIPQQDQSEFLREFLKGVVPEEEIEKRILKHQEERFGPIPRSVRDNVHQAHNAVRIVKPRKTDRDEVPQTRRAVPPKPKTPAPKPIQITIEN